MLKFSNLHKSYVTGKTVVKALTGVNSTISSGTSVALCGPSGSGKSTLLNICGLLDPDYQGSLYLDGQLVPSEPKKITQLRREKIGFIFQRYNLIPVMSAFENVEYPLLMLGVSKAERQRRVADMLARVGLKDFALQRPDQLSGGQQQRVAIARALVKQPALVIADEPTANLDTQTAYLVIELMRTLGRQMGTTFLVATHDHRMTEKCDRELTLIDGKIIESPATSSVFPGERLCAG